MRPVFNFVCNYIRETKKMSPVVAATAVASEEDDSGEVGMISSDNLMTMMTNLQPEVKIEEDVSCVAHYFSAIVLICFFRPGRDHRVSARSDRPGAANFVESVGDDRHQSYAGGANLVDLGRRRKQPEQWRCDQLVDGRWWRRRQQRQLSVFDGQPHHGRTRFGRQRHRTQRGRPEWNEGHEEAEGGGHVRAPTPPPATTTSATGVRQLRRTQHQRQSASARTADALLVRQMCGRGQCQR